MQPMFARMVFPWLMAALIVAGLGAAGWYVSGSVAGALFGGLVAASFVRPGAA